MVQSSSVFPVHGILCLKLTWAQTAGNTAVSRASWVGADAMLKPTSSAADVPPACACACACVCACTVSCCTSRVLTTLEPAGVVGLLDVAQREATFDTVLQQSPGS